MLGSRHRASLPQPYGGPQLLTWGFWDCPDPAIGLSTEVKGGSAELLPLAITLWLLLTHTCQKELNHKNTHKNTSETCFSPLKCTRSHWMPSIFHKCSWAQTYLDPSIESSYIQLLYICIPLYPVCGWTPPFRKQTALARTWESPGLVHHVRGRRKSHQFITADAEHSKNKNANSIYHSWQIALFSAFY